MTLAGNKFSKNILAKYKNVELTNQLTTINKLSRNNSCGEINKNKDKDKYKMKNLKNPYTRYSNTNNKNYTSYGTTLIIKIIHPMEQQQ